MKNLFSFNLNSFCKPAFAHFLKQGVLLAFLLLAIGFQAHATHTWTGAVNNNCNNAGNWSPASVPNLTDFVVIPNVAIDPEMKTGDVFYFAGLEIETGATLKLNVQAQLFIDASIGSALLIEGALENFGGIFIGHTTGINGYGIYNKGTVLNRQSGLIVINRCSGNGIFCVNSEMDNYGRIVVGNISSLGSNGIYANNSTFSNYENAVLNIDGTATIAYWNGPQSNVRNFGEITIGSKTNVGMNGIQNNGEFTNYNTGKIQIDRVNLNSILNESTDPFNNLGLIQIGSVNVSGIFGINNRTQLNNFEGEIIIDNVQSGVHNDINGTFFNSSKLLLGSNWGLGNYGITNGGTFQNSTDGLITIDRTNGYGIETHEEGDGSFTNNGKIIIGGAAPLLIKGIYNDAPFFNNAGAEIQINHCTDAAIENDGGSSFENKGKILIGQIAAAGEYGIKNYGGFINRDIGKINIDRTSITGLKIFGVYENQGSLIIGDVSSPGTYGIHNNSGIFINNGLITADRATQIGFYNEIGTIENSGDIVIRGVSSNYSVKNLSQWFSYKCSKTVLQDAVWNDGEWLNYGLLSVNTTEAHTNVVGQGNYFVNHGVIEYPKGSPIPNVLNHDLIAIPVIDNCNSITPALSLGDQLNFTVGTTWYNSSAFNVPVGTYNQATNTFIATALASELHLRVHDDINGCDFWISTKANYQMDLVPPTAVCKNSTAELNAAGTATVNPAQVFQSGTDNCGVVSPASVSPASFQCSNIGANTVTLTVNDGNGNNATCQATVTVLDKLGPTLICKPFSANLNAAGTVSIIPANVFQSGTDNCGVVNIQSVSPSTFTCANLGNQLVTLTANDGHSNTGTCQATVTVADKIAPTMICKPITVSLNAAGQASLSAAQVNNGSYDNCGIVSMVLSKSSFDCSNIGTNNISLDAMDQSSNKGQCFAIITVIDPINPVALCKNVTVNLGADGNQTLAGQAVNNGTSDNCSFVLSVSPAYFNCGNIGVNTVTLKATDTGGNTATCTSLVTIKDATAPTARCKNTILFLNDVGQATLTTAQINNGSSDACGISTMTLSKSAFNCADLPGSSQTIQLTLKDASNNSASCNAQVTIKDNLTPTAVCENTSIKLGPNGTATVYTANLAADSYDNCSVWSYAPIAKVYTTANIGNNNLTITVKDWSANGSNCVSVVQVLPFGGLQGQGEDRDGNTLAATASLSLFPNPSAGAGTLTFELSKEQHYTVILFDLTGKIVWSHQGTGTEGANTLPISLTNVPSAVYFLDFQSETIKKQTRWVIQN